MKSLIFVRDIFKKFPFLLIVDLTLLCIVTLLETIVIFTVVPLVDFFIRGGLNNASFITRKIIGLMSFIGIPATVSSIAVMFLLFNIFSSLLQVLFRHLILRTKYSVLRDLMLGTFRDFFSARWYFFSSNRQGVLLNTFINEMTVVGNAFGAMALFFTSIVQMIIYLAVPFYLSWQVTLISIGMALLLASPFILLGKVNYRLGKLNTATANEVSAVIQEGFSLAKLVLGFGNQQKSLDLLKSAFDAHQQATLKSQTLTIAIPLIYYPLGLCVIIIALFIAPKFNVSLSISAALLYSLFKVIPFIGQLATQKNSLDNFFPSYEQVIKLRQCARELKQITGNRPFIGFSKEIIIENVTFAYPGQRPVLTNINMSIQKGKMIALLGKSGVGKSTLIDLIMGFDNTTSGRITLDGVDLQEFDIISYRQKIGYVPQEGILFNTTVRQNLLWACESVTDEEIKQACRQANAEEFIEELPYGYNTLVGDRGVRLSGGQIQRIALARAILRKAEILLLDEATSSLDTHSERLIQQAIENIAKETTIIVIAHRLSTIINADYIYVLKNGCIVEEGNYQRLINQNGEFYHMLKMQSLAVENQWSVE